MMLENLRKSIKFIYIIILISINHRRSDLDDLISINCMMSLVNIEFYLNMSPRAGSISLALNTSR